MGSIRITHYTIDVGPYGFMIDEPFSMAVIADMHDEVYRSSPEGLAEAIISEKVSAVLSVGDLVTLRHGVYSTGISLKVMKYLKKCVPVYAIKGNHEKRMEAVSPGQFLSYEERMRMLGVTWVGGRSEALSINGVKFTIYGLELERFYFRRFTRFTLEKDQISSKIGDPCKYSFNILLAHHPKYFSAYASWGADLTLAGHLHGGIVRLPLVGGLISPDPSFFPRYDHGSYDIGRAKMIVSAGLGTHTINLRINNPAELVILDFK